MKTRSGRSDQYVLCLLRKWTDFADKHKLPPLQLGRSEIEVIRALEDNRSVSQINEYLRGRFPEDGEALFHEWTVESGDCEGKRYRELTEEERREREELLRRFAHRSDDHVENWQERGMF